MSENKSYRVNAFVGEGMKGNPACVTLLNRPLPKDELLAMAAHNGLPETAFILDTPQGLCLRWFTPDIEMDLCGHATLASAYVAFRFIRSMLARQVSHPSFAEPGIVAFFTVEGVIKVRQCDADTYILDFPQRIAHPAELPRPIWDSLSLKPREILLARDYLLVYDSEDEIRQLAITDRALFDSINLDPGGVAATAPGRDVDFVSRFFTPQATILEDPVTGSAHCSLAPFWAERLEKTSLSAAQLSERGGLLHCDLVDGRVMIKGRAELSL